MNTQDVYSQSSVQVIGEGALRILSNAATGRVLACVTDAVYLTDQHDEVSWLIPAGKIMHPRGIQVTRIPYGLKVGTSYSVEKRTLVFDSGKSLDFSQSLVWKFPRLINLINTPISKLIISLTAIIDHLLLDNTPTGFGCLIKPILRLVSLDQKVKKNHSTSEATHAAWLNIHGIISAASTGDSQLWTKYAHSLVGLGEGLTPSGDDFLGSFLFAHRILSQAYQIELNTLERTYLEFIHQAKPLTNLISYTMLKDHICGYSLEVLSQLVNGLLREQPTNHLSIYAKQLISVGHSTGWDILSGFTAGVVAARLYELRTCNYL